MILWVDAQLSPALAPWISEHFGLECYSVRRLGLRDSADEEIFRAGREAKAVVMTKDADFVRLLEQYGPPPQVLWITLGNTSNSWIRDVLQRTLPAAVELFKNGEPLVEVSAPRS